MEPIGRVESAVGSPIDDVWGGTSSRIVLDATRFTAESLMGLAEFSHVEVLFAFHLADEAKTTVTARHPRGNTAWPKAGIFAQRGKDRPNHIGSTICRIVGVEGLVVEVAELDAIDGTPVLDLKPYMVEFAPRGEVRQPEWSRELMRGYFVAKV